MKRNQMLLWIGGMVLLACGLVNPDGFLVQESPLPTPTFMRARFTTPTSTVPATETSVPTLTPVPVFTQPPLTSEAAEVETEGTEEIEAEATEEAEAEVEVEETEENEVEATDEVETEATDEIEVEETEEAESINVPPPATATPTETPSPTPAALSGRIAFSIDDGGGHYDIWAVELPDGEPFQVMQRARQPSFSYDGRLIVNLEASSLGEHIGILDSNYAWLGEVSDYPADSHPYWHPDGSRYVYDNTQMLKDPSTGNYLPHIFIPCSLNRPFMEENVKCRDIGTGGKVAIGEHPVWTDDDRIVFFTAEGEDGLYVISAASALWEAGGLGGKALLVHSNGRPNDTQGYQVFFSAGNLDGNWEAYKIDLDGTNLVNLSNSDFSQDGLPAVSPDGNWVAFVSDRDGLWGIWVVPIDGGEPEKIVDFSKINTNPVPWGTDERHWTTERLTWGP